MKCNNCNAEWTINERGKRISKCPFCGQDLTPTFTLSNKMSMSIVMKQIIERFGAEIISQGSKFISIFGDLAPELKKEQTILSIAMKQDISRYFLNCPLNSREENIRRAIHTMTDVMSENAIQLIISSFIIGLNWDETLISKFFPANVQISTDSKTDVAGISIRSYKTKVTTSQAKYVQEHDKSNAPNIPKVKKDRIKYSMSLNPAGLPEDYIKFLKHTGQLSDITRVSVNQTQSPIQILFASANSGDISAMLKVGNMYLNGHNLTKDYNEALKWYQRAANSNNADAMERIGWMYHNGLGVVRNYSKAMEWYEKASNFQHADAMYHIGQLYQEGLGVTKNDNEAIRWYRNAAREGNIDAMYHAAKMYQDGENIPVNEKEAMILYQKAANAGHVESMFQIGYMNENWLGESHDYIEAMKWYQNAVQYGHIESMFRIGYMYEFGAGVPASRNEAMKWYRKAADRGNTEAMRYIGHLYENSLGDSHNYTEAIKWFVKSANLGNKEAMYWAGYQYLNGYGVTKDENEALNWFTKAAAKGHTQAKEFVRIINKRRSPKSSCFITTAVCTSLGKPDECYELSAFRHFRDHWLRNQPDGKSLISQYYKLAPLIVDCIDNCVNSNEIYLNLWNHYLLPCLSAIESNDYPRCKYIYMIMVRELQKNFA